MKKSKNLKKQPKPQELLNDGIRIGSIRDKFLKADIKVKDTTVIIDIDGFRNEFDAMMWARLQSELWLKEMGEYKPKNNITLH